MEENIRDKFINKDIHGNEYNRTLLIIVIMIGSFVTILNQTILSTALPQIMGHFQITASTVQWLTTAFMFVIAITVTSLVMSFFLKDKNKNKNVIRKNNTEQVA